MKNNMLKPCNLARVYSIASLLGIVLVSVTLIYFYKSMATDALTERESQANTDLAHTIGNTLWSKYADFVWHATDIPLERLPTLPVIDKIHQDILRKVEGLRVVKVKIYDLNGLVVFSTQRSQIGSNKGDNRGFIQARNGRTASEFMFRDQFSAYEGSIYNRNLVASYVPVRRSLDQEVEGVFEIYSDITPLVTDIDRTGQHITLTVVTMMLLLYLFLMVLVRRGQKQINAYEQAQQREQLQRVDYLEYHDELTGLLNRKGLLRRMQRVVEVAVTPKMGVGVIAIKLLNLSNLSGGLGQQRFAQLLRLVAERVESCSSGSHNLGRLGSSEFVLIVENLFSDKELAFIVDRMVKLFCEPFTIDEKTVTLTLALGLDSSWRDKDAESLLNNVLLALSECERQGRQTLRYDENMALRKLEYLNLEMELSQALQRREFVLHYQPKIDVKSGKVSGMEALVRWVHPQRGLVMPGSFIGLLEERGYIVEVGEWLLRQACEQCKRWRDEGNATLQLAVNISLYQLMEANFVDTVADIVRQSELPPEALELELTESILAEDTEQVLERLKALKALGLRLSIDDFGTGYSSLSYLLHFPFDQIKIDRSFIRDMMHNRDHAVLTRAIVTMAKSLHLGVVAEGVESAAQLALVQEMGCDEVQGFYFSQAVATEHFVDRIAKINAGETAHL